MSGIIVGVDGSGHSHRALEWAAREAALRQTALTVLTVHQPLSVWAAGPVVYPVSDGSTAESARELAEREANEALKGIGDHLPAEVTVRAVDGLPAEELLRAADGAELLVVGSRGAGGFARLLMGSVSSQVTHHANCPVVVIPDADRS
ncbi:MAG TPA: universal stress protein [Trebonia sp.]|nr:universal stress protein [Trebonia sp.]